MYILKLNFNMWHTIHTFCISEHFMCSKSFQNFYSFRHTSSKVESCCCIYSKYNHIWRTVVWRLRNFVPCLSPVFYLFVKIVGFSFRYKCMVVFIDHIGQQTFLKIPNPVLGFTGHENIFSIWFCDNLKRRTGCGVPKKPRQNINYHSQALKPQKI